MIALANIFRYLSGKIFLDLYIAPIRLEIFFFIKGCASGRVFGGRVSSLKMSPAVFGDFWLN